MDSYNILALDQASHTTGWSVFQNDQLLQFGKFELNETKLGRRLNAFKFQVRKLIETYNINKVVFEDIQLQQGIKENVKTYKVLAEVIGVLEALLDELNIPYEIVVASSWKSAVGVKGANRAAQKKAAQTLVTNKFNIKATQDESDAICIGLYATQQQETADFNWV